MTVVHALETNLKKDRNVPGCKDIFCYELHFLHSNGFIFTLSSVSPKFFNSVIFDKRSSEYKYCLVAEDVFYTKLSHVFPDDDPVRFLTCGSFSVLV